MYYTFLIYNSLKISLFIKKKFLQNIEYFMVNYILSVSTECRVFFVGDNFKPVGVVTLDRVAYNCPWLKTGLNNLSQPALEFGLDFYWLSLHNIILVGIVFFWRQKRGLNHLESLWFLEWKLCFQSCSRPVMILPSITHLESWVIIKRVPLHRPLLGLMFLNKIND